ncbi:MAG: bifunctional molybdenum cofactor biosynthesis protein MoaC/MoaB, partial [Sediminibacterium sp.]|jgi:molybdenum cofactor biosynthesis protein MoaC|nr:bifunctional molybdenum cofactor biosynthesis protein MoaC/MoaB [Sediminibacterium sp.]
MVDILNKTFTQRTAVACASVLVGDMATIDALLNLKVPKGNVLEVARTAGLFAAKRTSDMIPDCHPLPIEFTKIEYSIDELKINIEVTVSTIYKTGVEVEAMHAASVVALTMYDMLKPIDKNIEIHRIHLKEKSGGKSDYSYPSLRFSASVISCSKAVFEKKKEDVAGEIIVNYLEKNKVELKNRIVVPNQLSEIQAAIQTVLRQKESNVILLYGGSGLSSSDITPEAVIPLLEKHADGIGEVMRSYGQMRSPNAMLSRSLAGTIGNTLVVVLPGSSRGAEESMNALFPYLKHFLVMIKASKI